MNAVERRLAPSTVGVELGRAVIVGDIAAVHPGDPSKCICKGTAEIPYVDRQRDPGTQICARAMDAFRVKTAGRVIDTPGGPRWRRGMSPEEWGFYEIFQLEVQAFEWRQEFCGRRASG